MIVFYLFSPLMSKKVNSADLIRLTMNHIIAHSALIETITNRLTLPDWIEIGAFQTTKLLALTKISNYSSLLYSLSRWNVWWLTECFEMKEDSTAWVTIELEIAIKIPMKLQQTSKTVNRVEATSMSSPEDLTTRGLLTTEAHSSNDLNLN
jgi:hypothetical protein